MRNTSASYGSSSSRRSSSARELMLLGDVRGAVGELVTRHACLLFDLVVVVVVAAATTTSAALDVALLGLLRDELVVFLLRAGGAVELLERLLPGGADLAVARLHRAAGHRDLPELVR